MNQPGDRQTEGQPTISPPVDPPAPANPTGPSDESPDRDTPAWEGAEPDESVGLIDPRPEIRMPPGL